MSEALCQQQFLEVIDRDEAQRRFQATLDLRPLEAQIVPLGQALGRVLAEDVAAPLDVPSFDRANVDGFAVQAADTFGASEDRPRALFVNTEPITTGTVPKQWVQPGTAMPIATGGMLPRGADAVVMIEHTDSAQGRLLLTRPVAPGANITFAGTDIGQGEIVLRRGGRLTSRETGVLAALGLDRVSVIRRPRVAILSTGDELLPPGMPMRPGMVHDSNSTVLADAVRELGGEPVPLGIVPDDDVQLDAALQSALDHDVILLSGGTSKGAGDLSYRAVARLGPPGIVAHGVALKPGKPLCLAVVERPGRRPLPIAVLPGFPTSAIFTFREFLAPVIRCLAGVRARPTDIVHARLPLRVNSERGRTEYLLVGLIPALEHDEATSGNGQATSGNPQSAIRDPQSLPAAYPMGKGSGSVTAFSRADGFVVIGRQREYLERDSVVAVHLLDAGIQPADLVVIGSHCTGLDYLLGQLHGRGVTSKVLAVGSTGGLEAARRGECDLAGIHLLDPATDTYNRPFLTEELELVPGYGRLQGLVYRPGDSRFEGKTVAEATAAALADPQCVLVNRNRGSGTRLLIDRLLGSARPPGFLTEAKSHNAVSAAVAQGRADWGVAIAPVARACGLGFLPLREEQYDFVLPRARCGRAAVQAFVDLLHEPDTRRALVQRGFHPPAVTEGSCSNPR
jgi:putative molybdopterin biosynthesis protein